MIPRSDLKSMELLQIMKEKFKRVIYVMCITNTFDELLQIMKENFKGICQQIYRN